MFPAHAALVRPHLDALAAMLGGDWALAEHGEGGLVVATSASLADALGRGWAQTLERCEASGMVIPLTSRQPLSDATTASSPRYLIAADLPAAPAEGALAGVLAVLAQVLGDLADAGLREEHDRRRAERLELRASTDPMTGLLNRRGWDRLLTLEEDRCRRHGLSAEIVVVDLDGLKAINDEHGHAAGDALIMRAATFIFSAVRVHDAVARLGGDEFAVLAVDVDPAVVAGQCPEAVGRRVEECLVEAEVQASVGAARLDGDSTLADTWRMADLRMYRAKQQHRRRRRTAGSDASPPAPTRGAATGDHSVSQ